MTEIFVQGDLLLELVADIAPSGTVTENLDGLAMVLAEGEESGHRHAIWDRVTMFRDERLATDIPVGPLHRPCPGLLGLCASDTRRTCTDYAFARNLSGSPAARARAVGRARSCRLERRR